MEKARKKFDDGLTVEQLDEIADELKKMTPGDLRSLHYQRGDIVNLEESGKRGKPVIVTDMRNLREFYCESIVKCAKLLGTKPEYVSMAVRGKLRQIGNYQIRLLNGNDGIAILQGIYKRYMDMLEQKKEQLAGKDEEEKIQREMDDINAQIEQMMQEKSEKIDGNSDV